MNYVIENISVSKKILLFDFGKEEVEAFGIDARLHSSLREKQKSVALRGFRKGKAPLDMIEKIYGAEMERNIFQDFMFQKIGNAVEKESLEVITILPVEDLQYKKGESLSFKVGLEVVPKVELKDVSDYVFTKGDPTLTEEEFDRAITDIWRAPYAEMREVSEEGAILEGERYGIFDIQGSREDGSVGVAEREYWLGPDSKEDFLGFREKVSGMKKGEKKSFELVVGKDYAGEELRGSKLSFDVELLEIKEYILPELDDSFAKERGFETAEEMKNSFRERMVERKREGVEERLRHDIEKRLLEDNPFELPEKLVVQREKEAVENIRKNFDKSGYDRKHIKPYMEANKKDIREQVLRTTKLSLIFRSLIKKYHIEIAEEESNRSVEDKIFKKILENVTVQQEEALP